MLEAKTMPTQSPLETIAHEFKGSVNYYYNDDCKKILYVDARSRIGVHSELADGQESKLFFAYIIDVRHFDEYVNLIARVNTASKTVISDNLVQKLDKRRDDAKVPSWAGRTQIFIVEGFEIETLEGVREIITAHINYSKSS